MTKETIIIPLDIPQKCLPFLNQNSRYKACWGGRGSAKSWTFARLLIAKSAFTKKRVLCTREMQNSIRDSVHRTLADQIQRMKLDQYFTIQKDAIYSDAGSEFIFKGLRHNISEIKSIEGIDYCWVEEAEKVSEDSWNILIPTIRKEGSEIWVSFNPELEESATYKRFVLKPPPDALIIQMNYTDNFWFPDVLRKEMEYDKRVDFEKYEHVWLGKTKKYAHALIFKNKFRVEEFATPSDARFFFGADWGFSNDPSVLGRMFIRDRKLFIDWEAYGVGVELNELEAFFDSVPGSRKYKIIGDSARPDTVSLLKNNGFNITGAGKGKGSVEDGIQFLRSFEQIIIHPRCPHAYQDFNNYKWKVDRITNEVIPVPAEGSDHWPDAARYALEDYIKAKVTIYDILRK